MYFFLDSCENEENADTLSKIIPEVTLTIPVKNEREETYEHENSNDIMTPVKVEVSNECPVLQDEILGKHPVQNENISPT